jgi:hypothetical protein
LTTAAWTGWVYFNEMGLQSIGDGLECLCQFAADLNFNDRFEVGDRLAFVLRNIINQLNFGLS